ncbi:hypothetical protein F2Q69_00034164 [Brassica cretica]|uniref:Uncharacterized protein n=1 Tax=Brassica cretica TaxID=69181 RepID=A0A8S9STV4_BRACR|nr:hypothetical protein F2Q69_00034164 [Brassica cretica]
MDEQESSGARIGKKKLRYLNAETPGLSQAETEAGNRSRTVPVIEEGPCEQRNQLFTVLGSLTDPEEEESKDSSEVNSMRSLVYNGEKCSFWS